jgi:replicative DNA helicase
MRTEKSPLIPPHNIDAEIAILGGCFLNEKIIHPVKLLIQSDYFYREAHAIIFSAIEALDHIDLVTVSDWLSKNRLLEKVGGSNYLTSIINSVSTSAGYRYWCDILIELADKRKLISQCQLTMESCFDPTLQMPEILEAHEKSVSEIENHTPRYQKGVHISNVYTPEKSLQAYSDHIKSLKNNRFITGIHEIDKRIRGVAGGEVLYIMARPGSFKTAMLQNMVKNYIQHSAWGSVIFEIEMPVASMAERYMEIITGSTGKDIEYHYTSEDAQKYREEMEGLYINDLKNLFIVPTKVSLPEIQKYISLIKKYFKIKIGLIGIDYLGLIDGPGQKEYDRISEIAPGIKVLAKTLNIPIVCLVQLNRSAAGEEVEAHHGRGAGQIEESADFILGMWLEYMEMAYPYLICKILKNRKGGINSRWQLDLDHENLKIGSETWKWEPKKKKKSKIENGYEG